MRLPAIFRSLLFLSATVLFVGRLGAQTAPPVYKLSNCLVSLVQEAQVPAQEPGVLVEVKVREGQQVEAGQLLCQVDQTKAKMEYRVADGKLSVAKEKASDDINVRYAMAAADVAKAELEVNEDANRRVPRAVPMTEINKLILKCKETTLAIDKSKLDMRVAGHEATVSQAEADGAQENIYRRQIKSPLDGVVVELHRHLGEWVQPGDQVLHIVRIDRLWVEGYAKTTDLTRAEVQDRPVLVQIKLPHGQTVTIPGTVIFAKPTTEAGGAFLVRAEIMNQKQNGYWVLSPGLSAEMTIQLR